MHMGDLLSQEGKTHTTRVQDATNWENGLSRIGITITGRQRKGFPKFEEGQRKHVEYDGNSLHIRAKRGLASLVCGIIYK